MRDFSSWDEIEVLTNEIQRLEDELAKLTLDRDNLDQWLDSYEETVAWYNGEILELTKDIYGSKEELSWLHKG